MLPSPTHLAYWQTTTKAKIAHMVLTHTHSNAHSIPYLPTHTHKQCTESHLIRYSKRLHCKFQQHSRQSVVRHTWVAGRVWGDDWGRGSVLRSWCRMQQLICDVTEQSNVSLTSVSELFLFLLFEIYEPSITFRCCNISDGQEEVYFAKQITSPLDNVVQL